MTLAPGTTLSHYRLVEKIGEGGMGVVWRATDSTLGRDVAIKVLPESFAADPERLARFDREARVLASLSHPSIAAIYGLHADRGVRFLAMEFVEGEDLAARLKRGPLPVPDALAIARQIAEALESANERGIVHRDLKPANVLLSPDGRVKLLDFGLAKAFEGDGRAAPSGDLSRSPTLTGHMTSPNVILGTAAYMSPEQARGQEVDKRADIWAFGVVLFEMLTGRQLFLGETVSDTLAAILKTDPDWGALPAEAPPRVRALLRRCLERDRRRRLRDVGEARILLEDAMSGAPEPASGAASSASPGVPTARSRFALVVAASAAFLVGAALALLLARPQSSGTSEKPLRRFRVAVHQGPTPSAIAISPDGRAIAYAAGDRLWIQDLEALEPRALATHSEIRSLFWSPDGQFVGYISGTKVFKVPASGGEGQTVCDTRKPFTGGTGGTWREDGKILVSRGDSDGILEVSALGGDTRTLVAPDSSKESDFHEPCALPGGRGVLYVAHRRREGIGTLCVWSPKGSKDLLTVEGQVLSQPAYDPSGYVLFTRGPTNAGVWAFPFSLERLDKTGEPFLVVPNGFRESVAHDGTLVYSGGSERTALQLAWVDREGREVGAIGTPMPRMDPFPSLAPDGVRIGVSTMDSDTRDIWILDAVRGTKTRYTFEPGSEVLPFWTPDGTRIIYHATPKNCADATCWSLVMRASDGRGDVDTLAQAAGFASISPDGRTLLYTSFASGMRDLWTMPMDKRTPAVHFLQETGSMTGGQISPDGRYVAYVSEESGHREIYLRRFPAGEGKWQVSVSGGMWPRWSGRGDRLCYSQGDDVMEVEVSLGESPTLGTPRKLFTREPLGIGVILGWDPGFDVAPDGTRFVIAKNADAGAQSPGITVVQNWLTEFKGERSRGRR